MMATLIGDCTEMRRTSCDNRYFFNKTYCCIKGTFVVNSKGARVDKIPHILINCMSDEVMMAVERFLVPNFTTSGVTHLRVTSGGGDLTSTMVLDDEATTSQSCIPQPSTSSAVQTRSVGQTCQPSVHQTSCQAISCIRCGELGHTARLCITSDPSKPPLLSFLFYSYIDDTTITINLKTPQKKPKHEAAAKVLQKIDNMMEKFNKIKILVHG